MPVYSEITDAEIAVGKPVSSILLAKYRDNYEAVYNYRFGIAKLTSTARPNQDTVEVDPDLHFPVGPNEVWRVRLLLLYFANSTAHVDVKLFVSAETETGYFFVKPEGLVGVLDRQQTGTESRLTSASGAGAIYQASVDGYVYTGAVGAGDEFEVQWAQGVSDAQASQLIAGSALLAWRMDDL